MTDPMMTLLEYMRKQELTVDRDFLQDAVRVLVQMLIEAEVTEQIGAGRYERVESRRNQRNGYRKRDWETRVDNIPLQIPKLRKGSYFPSLLEPRKRSEKALLAVVQEAYVKGVSTRKVDDLVKALGLEGMDKSKVSRICKELNEQVTAFRTRPLDAAAYPYLWLDALYVKVRQNHRVVSMAIVVAVGLRKGGEREVLGFDVGAAEDEAFWTAFLRRLKQRGLKNVELVVSDAHEGLKSAVETALVGSSWQRCRVHVMRNVLSHIPQANKSVVAAALRTIFAQPNKDAAHAQLGRVVESLQAHWPKAAQVLLNAECDVLTYMDFPPKHWRRIYSTNMVERLNKEIKRRTKVVEIFPDVPSLERLVGALLVETNDEWQTGRRYFSQESMRQLYEPDFDVAAAPTPLPLAPVH